jgi:hypothetical protein
LLPGKTMTPNFMGLWWELSSSLAKATGVTDDG